MTAPETGRKPYDLTLAAHDYPSREGPPRRSVLICTHPRSGSTLLAEALYFAGGLGCPLEYFHQGFMPGLAARWGTGGLEDYIATVHRLRTDPQGALGVKLFWRDIEYLAAERDPARFGTLPGLRPDAVPPETYRAVAAALADIFPHADYVHLRRRDRVRQAISSLAAMQTGVFRMVGERQESEAAAKYDFGRIEYYLAYSDFCHRHWDNFFAAIGQSPYQLSCEALATDYAETVGGALAHLGSSAVAPPPRLLRQYDSVNEAFVLRYLRDKQRAGTT